MEQGRKEKIDNLITLYNQICIYLTVVVIYVMVRAFRKKKVTSSKGTDFLYNTDCPICFNAFTVPIKSDCGHGFCLDCLYTYWKKPSWNSMCPLCRKIITNLKPIEDGIFDTWTPDVSEKINRITSKNLYRFKLGGNSSTIYSVLFCAIFLILWTYTVSNLNKMMYYIVDMYNSIHDIRTEINM